MNRPTIKRAQHMGDLFYRLTVAEARTAELTAALEEIKALEMTREAFMMRGPAFACKTVELVCSIARQALALNKVGDA